MPIYTWYCEKCEYVVEVLQSLSENIQNCPNCKTAMEKQVSAVGRPVIK